MADDGTRVPEIPYPPPAAAQTTMMLVGLSLVFAGIGFFELILWLLVECLHRLHLWLGLFQVAVGLGTLWWTLSWWMPMNRRGLRAYEAELERTRQHLAVTQGRLERERAELDRRGSG